MITGDDVVNASFYGPTALGGDRYVLEEFSCEAHPRLKCRWQRPRRSQPWTVSYVVDGDEVICPDEAAGRLNDPPQLSSTELAALTFLTSEWADQKVVEGLVCGEPDSDPLDVYRPLKPRYHAHVTLKALLAKGLIEEHSEWVTPRDDCDRAFMTYRTSVRFREARS